MKHNILLIDDDPAVRSTMKTFLDDEGFYTKTVESGEEGIALVRQKIMPFSLALVDIHMPGMKGDEAIREIQKINPELTLLAFSGDDSVANHNGSLDSGAIFFLAKDTNDDKILGIIHRICREVERKIKPLAISAPTINSQLLKRIGMIGISDKMADVAKAVFKFAPTDNPVLITGENGTGKEMIAKAIHDFSDRASQKFIAINCGAISASLIESELFGYKKGAFTGADKDTLGKFEAADGGTIFLDEIGDMPYSLQVKMLRVLQNKEVCRVGANEVIKVNIRVIAATNASLDEMIKSKEFREDLYHRLCVLPIRIPALRERPEDIPVLVNEFLRLANLQYKSAKTILASSVEILKEFRWTGNVRQLQHTVSYLVRMSDGDTVDLCHLPQDLLEDANSHRGLRDFDTLRLKTQLEEKGMIVEALRLTNNATAAARKLKMKRSTLRDKIKKFGIKIEKAITNKIPGRL